MVFNSLRGDIWSRQLVCGVNFGLVVTAGRHVQLPRHHRKEILVKNHRNTAEQIGVDRVFLKKAIYIRAVEVKLTFEPKKAVLIDEYSLRIA